MIRQGTHRFEAGLLAAILAATLQFVLWAAILAAPPTQPHPTSITAECSHAPSQAPHKDLACLLCPVCLTASLPAFLPAAAPTLLPPAILAVLAIARPGNIRAPPAAPHPSPYPRGPPLT